MAIEDGGEAPELAYGHVADILRLGRVLLRGASADFIVHLFGLCNASSGGPLDRAEKSAETCNPMQLQKEEIAAHGALSESGNPRRSPRFLPGFCLARASAVLASASWPALYVQLKALARLMQEGISTARTQAQRTHRVDLAEDAPTCTRTRLYDPKLGLGNQLSVIAYAMYSQTFRSHGKTPFFCTTVDASFLDSAHAGAQDNRALLHNMTLRWGRRDLRLPVLPGVIVRRTFDGHRDCPNCFWDKGPHIFALEQILQQSIVPRLPAPDESHEVAVHFRCSDTPFCRNPSSRLLYDRFYHAAAAVIHERRRSPVRSILLVHCGEHWDPGPGGETIDRSKVSRATQVYAGHVRALLLRIFPLARVTRRCSSPHADLAAMLAAPFYIGSASSFSTFVAVLRTGPSVLPANNPWLIRANASYPPRVVVRDFEESQLPHELVADYFDTESVLQQLGNGTEAAARSSPSPPSRVSPPPAPRPRVAHFRRTFSTSARGE